MSSLMWYVTSQVLCTSHVGVLCGNRDVTTKALGVCIGIGM